MAAIENELISPSQLDPARIEFLLSHSDEKIRRQASRLVSSARLARREDAVAAYRDVLQMKGHAARGKAVFKKQCATCHKLEGVGYDLGLPLGTIKDRGPEGILLNVLDPNRNINPEYINYIVTTNEGRLITGK